MGSHGKVYLPPQKKTINANEVHFKFRLQGKTEKESEIKERKNEPIQQQQQNMNGLERIGVSDYAL